MEWKKLARTNQNDWLLIRSAVHVLQESINESNSSGSSSSSCMIVLCQNQTPQARGLAMCAPHNRYIYVVYHVLYLCIPPPQSPLLLVFALVVVPIFLASPFAVSAAFQISDFFQTHSHTHESTLSETRFYFLYSIFLLRIPTWSIYVYNRISYSIM